MSLRNMRAWTVQMTCGWCNRSGTLHFQGSQDAYVNIHCRWCKRGVRIQMYDGNFKLSNKVYGHIGYDYGLCYRQRISDNI